MRLFQVLGLLIMSFMISGCVKLTLAWADLKPAGDPATPAILAQNFPYKSGGITSTLTIESWEERRKPAIRKALEDHVYGVMPDASAITVLKRQVLDANAFGGRGSLEEITMTATATFNGKENVSRPFIIELIVPNNTNGPVPTILKQSFSSRWNTIPHPKVTGAPPGDPESLGGLATFVFGRYISVPPIAEILDRGYALAVVFPSEFVPDSAQIGLDTLRDLSQGHQDDATRWGAIAAWGWGYSRMIDALIDDPRLSPDGYISYGHSRYGKAALVAAAWDNRIRAVVSHQSGTGGASLNRRKKGESVKEITESYPHWFSQTYADYAGREEEMPIDQHHLLALMAPRPIFLGNARRDVWSDPNGTLKAAIGADPAWKLYGADKGLQQQRLTPYNPDAELSLWIRPGTHGVVKEDWPAFLQFLDAHL